jgi:hypothetical protein
MYRTKGISRCISFSTGGIFPIIHLLLEGGGHEVAQLVVRGTTRQDGRSWV